MPLPRPDPSLKTPELFSLKGKICVITGGARGIGLSITHAFLESSCSGLAITYTTSSSAPQLAEELSKQYGVPVKAYQVDVRQRQSIVDGFAQINKDFGQIDIVVANAGVSYHYNALEMPEDKYRDIMSINVDGVWWTATEAGKIFKKQAEEGRGSKGNFIVTGSVSASLVNVPQQQAAYNASKAAVVHMTKSIAVEWASWGGRANSISPGYIETDMIGTLPDEWKEKWHTMIPAERFCAPDELKGAYVFLASDASSYVTGTDLIIDGAYTLP